ncbi:MAG: hypothetical protein KDD33_09545 [Bdellovibrionales bacterium]|nr:hypothetical protein [Bdellovibrionales bacterium]
MKNKKVTPYRDEDEAKLLKRIGRRVQQDLFDLDKPIEWLSFESETARSTIRTIFNGQSNVGILTLHRISKALGYKNVSDFLDTL